MHRWSASRKRRAVKRGDVFIYGPVASRRLGSSLGVDLVPRKVCDYDCVYCQLGKTSVKTMRREPYVAVEAVLEQLERRLGEEAGIDYITLAGSGEPTLHSQLDEVIAGIRRLSEIPIAVITNGSLLGDGEVAAACARADLVVPSLDAADEETFQAVNRPCEGINLEGVVEGIASFRRAFRGEVWLEVMLVEGLNAREDQVREMSAVIAKISPHRVQLNTVVRPGAEPGARAVGEAELAKLAVMLGEGADAVPPLPRGIAVTSLGARAQKALHIMRRRPCTAEDVAKALRMNYTEAMKLLVEMEGKGLLSSKASGGKTFYVVP